MPKVILFSSSPLKLSAARETVFKYDVVPSEPGKTPFEQPVGKEEAYRALEARVAPLEQMLVGRNRLDIGLAIENFIQRAPDGRWIDSVCVLYVAASGHNHKIVEGNIHIDLPEDDVVDFLKMIDDGSTRTKTFGCMYAEKHNLPEEAAKDWFRYADESNPTRIEQIVDAIKQMEKAFADDYELAKTMALHSNWPREGVDFIDIFSPLTAGPGIINKYANALRSVYDAAIASPDWPEFAGTTVFGIESRGLFLGGLLAERLGAAFVPIRKAGKVPGPTWSCTYEKEYGSDTIEVAKDYRQPTNNLCVIVDDLIATGGSICAAIELLRNDGHNSFLVIGLMDVSCIRRQWIETIKKVAPTAKVRIAMGQ